MNPLPANPTASHARFMEALCEDFASPEFLRTGKTPRADAVAAVAGASPLSADERHRMAWEERQALRSGRVL